MIIAENSCVMYLVWLSFQSLLQTPTVIRPIQSQASALSHRRIQSFGIHPSSERQISWGTDVALVPGLTHVEIYGTSTYARGAMVFQRTLTEL